MGDMKEPKGGLAALLCLDTPERAKATIAWVLPYVVFCAFGMGAMSWGIAAIGFVDLALWQYALAIGIASVAVVFSLCLLRGLGMRHAAEEDDSASSG